MPGKIAHLVPMQRLDSVLHRQAVKSSNLDQNSPTKVPPQIATTITSALPTKLSVEDSPLTSRPYSDALPSQLHPSISSNSFKPSSNNPDDLLSHTRLRTMLSQFQEDRQLTPYRLDHKRSSVWHKNHSFFLSIYIYLFLPPWLYTLLQKTILLSSYWNFCFFFSFSFVITDTFLSHTMKRKKPNRFAVSFDEVRTQTFIQLGKNNTYTNIFRCTIALTQRTTMRKNIRDWTKWINDFFFLFISSRKIKNILDVFLQKIFYM